MPADPVVHGDQIVAWPSFRWPARAPIEGREVRLEPIDPAVHTADLYHASHADPKALAVWDYLAHGPFADEAGFRAWARDAAASADPVFFAIRRPAQGPACGVASMMSVRPKDGVIEIGHIWLAPSLQRTRAATEALFLLMREAMDGLRYRRLEWKCNALNTPSRRAALRLGFRFEGIFYRHMISKGRNRDTAWFSITDEEWPRIRSNIEAWLAPENFDGDGRALRSLAAMNAGAD
jgi:RimJ/RimL family protein N-acetyltransferase